MCISADAFTNPPSFSLPHRYVASSHFTAPSAPPCLVAFDHRFGSERGCVPVEQPVEVKVNETRQRQAMN